MAMNLLTNWLAVEQVQYPYLSMHVQVVGGTDYVGSLQILYTSPQCLPLHSCAVHTQTPPAKGQLVTGKCGYLSPVGNANESVRCSLNLQILMAMTYF